VVIVTEENGGWRDHYHFMDVAPGWLSLIIVPLIAFLVASLMRYLHNRMHMRRKKQTEELYLSSSEFALPSIEETVMTLAKQDKEYGKGGEMIVPRRIITLLMKKYPTAKSLSDLCCLYTKTYLNA